MSAIRAICRTKTHVLVAVETELAAFAAPAWWPNVDVPMTNEEWKTIIRRHYEGLAREAKKAAREADANVVRMAGASRQ